MKKANPNQECFAITGTVSPAEITAMGPGESGSSSVMDFLLTAVVCCECCEPLPISAPEALPPPFPHLFELPAANLRLALLRSRDLAEAVSISRQAKVRVPPGPAASLTQSGGRAPVTLLR